MNFTFPYQPHRQACVHYGFTTAHVYGTAPRQILVNAVRDLSIRSPARVQKLVMAPATYAQLLQEVPDLDYRNAASGVYMYQSYLGIRVEVHPDFPDREILVISHAAEDTMTHVSNMQLCCI